MIEMQFGSSENIPMATPTIKYMSNQ